VVPKYKCFFYTPQNENFNIVYTCNGIYFTWDKNTCTSQCRKWNSIMCRDVKLYQLGSKFIKKNIKQNPIGSFWFKLIAFELFFCWANADMDIWKLTSPDFFSDWPEKKPFYKIYSYQGFTSKQTLILAGELYTLVTGLFIGSWD